MIAEALAAVIVAFGLIIAATVIAGADRILTSRRRRQVYVTLKDGTAWHGVLTSIDRRMLVLRNATSHASPDQGGIAADGEVLLHRADVSFLQRP